MKITRLSLLPLLLVAFGLPLRGGAPDEPAPLASFGEPAISPDRSEIAVVSGGDIWTLPFTGGEARLLVSDEANESRPIYSPDGKSLAFISDRTGGGDIYLLTLATGALKQLTFDDGLDRLDGWSRDGKWIYFSSSSRDIAGMNDIFRVSVDGGTPTAVSADRYTSEFFAAPSPDGRTVAFSARGNSAGQWWRRGHAHLDESELWLLHDGPSPTYERLTEIGAKQMWPMWTADGRSLFFVSDRSGTQNIWTLPLGGTARQVTGFTDGRVLWPTISYDGKAIVFERDFDVWKMDTASGQASKVSITKRGAPAAPSLEHVTLNNGFSDSGAVPGWPQGRVRRARRDLGRSRTRRRRRRAGHAQLRARVPDRMAARQQAHRLRVGTRRRVAPLQLRLHLEQGSAAHEYRCRRYGAAGLARRQARRVRARREGPARSRPRVEGRALAGHRLPDALGPGRRVVARQQVGGLRWHQRQVVVPQHLCRPGSRRREPRDHLDAERQREQRVVEPRRNVSDFQHQPADGAWPDRPRGSDSAHAAIPRRSIPRFVQGRADQDRAASHPAGGSPNRADPITRSRAAGAGES